VYNRSFCNTKVNKPPNIIVTHFTLRYHYKWPQLHGSNEHLKKRTSLWRLCISYTFSQLIYPLQDGCMSSISPKISQNLGDLPQTSLEYSGIKYLVCIKFNHVNCLWASIVKQPVSMHWNKQKLVTTDIMSEQALNK